MEHVLVVYQSENYIGNILSEMCFPPRIEDIRNIEEQIKENNKCEKVVIINLVLLRK